MNSSRSASGPIGFALLLTAAFLILTPVDFQASSDPGPRKLLVTTANGTAVSTLPSSYTPGTAFIVSVVVTPASSVSAYGVEDQVPVNWVVSNISHSGAFDAVNNKVKWGPFFDNTARTLSYTITPPANASGSAKASVRNKGINCQGAVL